MDFARAIGDLVESSVPFVVIGGMLRPLYAPGNPRPTFDLDIVVAPGQTERLVRHLYARGFQLLLRFEPKPWTEPVVDTIGTPEEAIRHSAGRPAISFFRDSPYALVDVWLDIGVSFEELARGARRLELANAEVSAACPEDWRRLKAMADREKDRADLAAFEPPPDEPR